ncbi:MAG TPA: J domain-containing protein [Candidatus Thermoplasmatota archaeon]|nr:J domain-containing protein [Candidatus Thermoplasmatota archaeon]
MDARLDPACEGARALARRHRDQEHLLVAGSEGQLATIVRQTQGKQIVDHLVQCARCRHYDPRCPSCGSDARRERHGWMCPQQAARWRDLLPWNWRPRFAREVAPAAHAPFRTGHRPQAPPTAAATVRVPVQAAPGGAHVAPRVVPPGPAPGGAPKPRPRPQSPKPNALALAYAALGLAPEAAPEAVRAAYRSRAQQYHPDKVGHLAPEFRDVADKKMKEINAAYEKIKRSW